ncbi:MAG: bifunctional UDP-N-acetylglucosamine diphosphorylase/glucosamine-1-phosphate N-acetyltransferase GlmU [Gammaproteobacteria bacterium]|nr:bifunctional UDP-N-acetylglucosamine diphosphorylase/glucosamine-1-phosphate N-acetyltransferase GlmU [Gammaproteobacteria bacterium]
MPLSAVILAAGKGKRMRSSLPKVMHTLAGKTLLAHVYATAGLMSCDEIYIVYGHEGDQLRQAHDAFDAHWIRQERQLGTGHAVSQVIESIPATHLVIVLYGDVPLSTRETLNALVEAAGDSGFSLLAAVLEDPVGYGRIVRDDAGNILRIVEERDANEQEKLLCEINTGMMAVRAGMLKKWLGMLTDDNAQQEYLLTDIVGHAVSEGVGVNTVQPASVMEIKGVNDRAQLAELERHYQLVQARQLMSEGVTLADPARFDLRGDLEAGEDVFIDINVVIQGEVSIGNQVSIGPNCVIQDTRIGDGANILANCVIDNADIGARNRIGPFARIRPGSSLDEDVHIGNFVEIKQSEIGKGSKANHLSYIGDSEMGERVNVGAGTITCNYDGVEKHKTIIGNDVFIGSNTEIIAPLRINDGATIAAGATISKDVEAGSLAMSKREAKVVKDWKRGRKKKGSE